MDISDIIRPHIKKLKPYMSARDEFTGSAEIFLDANENPYENKSLGDINRYPDPHQKELKEALSQYKNIPVESIFISNGSDEALDLLMRTVVEPNLDDVIICPPTYGMYKVIADIQQVTVKEMPLREDFSLDKDRILSAVSSNTKIVFLCSPNNPTGNLLCTESIEEILKKTSGIVVVDEAYIDFSESESWLKRLHEFPNLVVLQTFSKAYGLAGLRVGVLYGNPQILSAMGKIKYPYNVSAISQKAAMSALQDREIFLSQLKVIISEREFISEKLKSLKQVLKVFSSHANYLLVQFLDHKKVLSELLRHGVIVRDRSNDVPRTLRITIGTPQENKKVIDIIGSI